MTNTAMKYIADLMRSKNINYQFGEWTTDPVPKPYFVGEFTDVPSNDREESGKQETDFILTGTDQTWIGLMNSKTAIENALPLYGILSNGNGIAVYYNGSMMVPVDDPDLKRIQINLTIYEWGVV